MTVPCGLCGAATDMTATRRCNRCWELERRIKMDPDLARRILGPLTFTIEQVELYEFRIQDERYPSAHFAKTAYFCAAFYTGPPCPTDDRGSMVFCYFNLGLGLEREDVVRKFGHRWGWWTGNSRSRVGTWPLRQGTPEQIRRREFHEGIGLLVATALRAGEAEILRSFEANQFSLDLVMKASVDDGLLRDARRLAGSEEAQGDATA